jgi:hypothetical protein
MTRNILLNGIAFIGALVLILSAIGASLYFYYRTRSALVLVAGTLLGPLVTVCWLEFWRRVLQ